MEDLISEFREYALKIEKAYTNLKKMGPLRRTVALKKKRIEEATAIWSQLSKVCTQIESSTTGDHEPCYANEKEKITNLYQNYMKNLMEIKEPTTGNTNTGSLTGRVGGGSSDNLDQNDDIETVIFFQKQGVRFDALKRALEDVEGKLTLNEVLTSAYCKLKSRMITDSWKRIQVADEECCIDRSTLSLNYFGKLEELETSVEEVLLILQEGIEVPRASTNFDAVKLPRVTIPKFNGDYFKWMSFRDLFTVMVIENKSLSDGQRMQMLKTNVGNEAETLISDLTIADVNFASAWQRLLNRYDNNRVVVSKHINKLMAQSVGKTDAKSVKKLLDITDQTLLALANMGRPTASWDDWIVIMITQKLSDECRKDWERKIGNSSELPTWDQLKQFLEEEFRMLEGVENANKRQQGVKQIDPTEKIKGGNGHVNSYQASVEKPKCSACEEDHGLFSCDKFKAMDPKQRWEMAKKHKLCFGCLQKHTDKLHCEKKNSCKKCKKKHSTWLHWDSKKESELVVAHGSFSTKPQEVLLATAIICINDVYGNPIKLRALIDSGSQGTMITERAASLLQYKPMTGHRSINGLGLSNTGAAKSICVKIRPRFQSETSIDTQCYILKRLTKMLPDSKLCTKYWNHVKGLIWADPTFHKPGQIDVLLGMDVIIDIMKPGLIKGSIGQPMAQNTQLGWIISGKIDQRHYGQPWNCLVATTDEESGDLSRFWEIEELNPKRSLTAEEQECEEFYSSTVKRDGDGSYIVKVPFINNMVTKLGTSTNQCMSRFFQLEKKFATNPALEKEYKKVMDEYLKLGHMVDSSHKPQTEKLYYIPHHAVIKPDSLTTKTRVVFDASAKTTTGISLNDCMHAGAKQQNDLLDVLIKWRKHEIVFKADVEKMYRQVKLDTEDQKYHTIIWRENPSQPLKEFQLTTATFGTASAPFMATRTLNQIAVDNIKKFPLAREVIQQDFYVDDLISGSNDLESSKHLIKEVMQSLQKGNTLLRKWTSNSKELLQTLPPELTERSLQSFSEEDLTKALGLQWNPRTDEFSFKVNWSLDNKKLTKRQLLAEASKLFDPLGWLAPIIITAKILMQQVWIQKIGWDDEVSSTIKEKWGLFKEQLPDTAEIRIPRWLHLGRNEPNTDIEDITVHCFCDASEAAFAAVVYTRVQRRGRVFINPVASKTRVAPVKTKQTLPRLELCGAVLGATLTKRVQDTLDLNSAKTYAWSDSMITLGWLQADPRRWKTFVANRIVEINACKIDHWRYVKSKENPADCASRGLMPNELNHHELWWNGPPWLKESKESWVHTQVEEPELDRKSISVNLAVTDPNDVFTRFSSWKKLVRFAAYGLRFKTKLTGPIRADELEAAKCSLFKQAQEESFDQELMRLKAKLPVLRKGKLLQLNPFIDTNGVMRVGGRLAKAKIPYEQKHPIILERSHPISKLVMRQKHEDTMHGGPELMMNLVKKECWIINGKKLASEIFSKCVICRRYRGQPTQQITGELPTARVTLDRTFAQTGVDYAGPVEIKTSKLRNAKIIKGYIAVYVCMATKAIHLELVSDATTEAFLASFERFVARRGLVKSMYSDNGTNLVGGANKLEKNWLHVKNTEVSKLVANHGIEWNFIPPEAPNFGGLWERAVRSSKDHLKRTLKTAKLTFEEYNTVLCNIEACLNSRPLCPTSNNPESMDVLTPGHFIIGEALRAPPAKTLVENTSNYVKRWNYLQILQQQFWKRWHEEYLTQLQLRQKWNRPSRNVQVGDMVVLKDENLPPRNWLMGRVEEIHPGADGKVRVATIRIKTNQTHGPDKLPKTTLLKRPVNKLCLLLLEEENRIGQLNNDEHPDDSDDDQGTVSKAVLVNKTTTTATKRQKYNLRPKLPSSVGTLLAILTVIMLFGGGLAVEDTSVKVSKFVESAGIYFEEIGRANIIRSQWHMYMKFDLKQYINDFEKLQTITQRLKESCAEMRADYSKSNCEGITNLLDHKMSEIAEFNKLLQETENDKFKRENGARSRRSAPLNIIGWAQHELFGVMAADQAEKIDEKLKLADQNADYLLQLAKKQTSIVEGTVNLMKSSQQEMNANYDKIERAIMRLTKEVDYVDRRIHLIDVATSTLAYVSRLEHIQENILDMITDLHQGHVSSHAFTPGQFKEQLELMNNNLPTGNMLPEIAQHDVQALYKIIRGSARITEKSIILEVIFPLVSTNEFQVFRIIPLPTELNGEQLTIVPDSEYLVINLKRDQFYQASQEDVRNCIKPRNERFICNLGKLIYNLQSTRSQCERDLLIQTAELNPSCKLTVMSRKDFWIKLTKKNSWIYGLRKKTTLTVTCGKETHSLAMEGSGLLEITPGCEVTQTGMTIIAESIKTSNGEFKYQPSLNLAEAVIRSSHGTFKISNLTLDHTEQMASLANQIHDLKQHSKSNKLHHISHYSGQFGMYFTMIMFAGIFWYYRTTVRTKILNWTHSTKDFTGNQTDATDLEDGEITEPRKQHGDSGIHHDSVDNHNEVKSSTVVRHKPGECPFRT